MGEVIVFDVNETLLDMRVLDPHFERAFGSAAARERWFKELESLWLVTIATGAYRDFTALAEAALRMVAERDGVDLSAKDRARILKTMNELPPHADAAPALERLWDRGLPLAALTNGTLKSAVAQLKNAGLHGYFDEVMSADEVERYKPAPAPYLMAAERLGRKPKELRLVAAHAWDIAGAHAAGLKTAFIARARKVLDPASPKPELEADDLRELAERILRKDG